MQINNDVIYGLERKGWRAPYNNWLVQFAISSLGSYTFLINTSILEPAQKPTRMSASKSKTESLFPRGESLDRVGNWKASPLYENKYPNSRSRSSHPSSIVRGMRAGKAFDVISRDRK